MSWQKQDSSKRTSSVVGGALLGNAAHERLSKSSLTSGALALDIGDTAAGAGDSGDKARDLVLVNTRA